MQALFANFLTVTLVAQSIFGCCRHGIADELVGNTMSSIIDGDCCHDCDHCRKTCSPGAPCHCKPQCKGVCTYLRGAKVRFDYAADWTQVNLATTDQTSLAIRHSMRVFSVDNGRNCLAPPLRLNLLNRVWLV